MTNLQYFIQELDNIDRKFDIKLTKLEARHHKLANQVRQLEKDALKSRYPRKYD